MTEGNLVIEGRHERFPNPNYRADAPHYLILNLAIGGAWGGAQGVDSSAFPQQFLIDYVRVYEGP